MILLIQLIENSARPLLAQSEKVLSGIFAEIDIFNQNGRSYPESIYVPAYEELIPKVKEKRLMGELDHPLNYDEVRLGNVSHVITDCDIVERNGVKQIYGSVELLDTPAGMIAQALVKAGIPLGISSRGLGNTRQVRDGVEVTSLKLITYDLVAEPSFSNAILSPDKSAELSDSLHYIESKLPLTESAETSSVRDMIYQIRESLIERKTAPVDELQIYQAEVDSLRELLESTHETIKSDTTRMIEYRQQIKSLQGELKESKDKYRKVVNNMLDLQDAYNELKENSLTKGDFTRLEGELLEAKKQLAVERRGMSYDKVSNLLEGASTPEDIENRLNSLSSVSRKRHQNFEVDKGALTESIRSESRNNSMTRLASIVANV